MISIMTGGLENYFFSKFVFCHNRLLIMHVRIGSDRPPSESTCLSA